MLEIILITVALVALVLAAYADLTTKEVPDWLNYGLIFAALGIRIIFSFQLGWNILLSGLLGLAVFFLLGLLFYRANQWGGGDSKLLMGMGAVIGFTVPIDASSMNLVWFFFSVLFLGSIYGLIWMMVIAIKKKEVFMAEFKKEINKYKKLHVGLWIMAIFFIFLGLFSNLFWFLALFPAAIYYLLLFVNAIEKNCFVSEVKISQLSEGDWLAEKVIRNERTLLKKKTLSRKDIDKLYQEKIANVKIKEGIPFIPSFLFAYLLVTFSSSIFIWLVMKLFG